MSENVNGGAVPKPTDDPGEAPETDTVLVSSDESGKLQSKEYPGIGRIKCLLYEIGWLLAFGIVIAPTLMPRLGFDDGWYIELGIGLLLSGAGIIIFAVAFGPILYFTILRLRNIGYSGWLAVAATIPFINIALGGVLLAAPAGYADHKKLDRAGRIVGTIYALFAILSALSMEPSTPPPP